MRSSQVYQPTTTSLPYSNTKTWVPSFLQQNDGHKRLKMFFIVFVSFFLLLGIIFIAKGVAEWSTHQYEIDVETPSSYIIFISLGVVFELIAVILIALYSRFVYYDPLCSGFCCTDKISKIRKTFHIGRTSKGHFNGQPVSAQYCPPQPPSVDSSPPAPFTDISEQQMLMGEREDIEKILEEDPRIVLTPLKNHEEC